MKLTYRLLVMLVITAFVFGGVFFYDAFRARMIAHFMKSFANPTQTVATVVAGTEEWSQRIEAVGTLRARDGADLSSDINGIVDQINFNSGDDVTAGAVLVRLRTEDDNARLQQLQTAVALAQTNYRRDQRQLADQAVARATVDTDLSMLRQAQAAAAQQQALLAKKTITAPFAGHLGIREVDIGQYVAAGTSIVTLQSLDPIYADFYIPQQDLAQLRIGQVVQASVDTYENRSFAGAVEAINARVDPATRTVQVRAKIANPDHALLPGMFATVQIDIGAPRQLITLPQTAITYNPYGSTVFLVDHGQNTNGQPQLTARQVFVVTGETRGDQVSVMKGVAAGDTVVVAGQIKLRNDTPVAINNSIMPASTSAPAVAEQ